MVQSEAVKARVAPSCDEYVLDELCICEEKLLQLMQELEASGHDLQQLTERMEAEEVTTRTSGFAARLQLHPPVYIALHAP